MSLNSLLYHKYSLELTSYAAHAPQLKGAVPFIVPSTMDSQNSNGTAQNRVTTVLDCSGCPNFGVGAEQEELTRGFNMAEGVATVYRCANCKELFAV